MQTKSLQRKRALRTALLVLLLSAVGMGKGYAQVSTWYGGSSPWTHGDGTQEAPYLIENANNLAFLANKCNEGECFDGKYFKQTIDIDLNNRSWTPIGLYSNNYISNSFQGHFDGDEHLIENLRVEDDVEFGYVGLFGRTQNAELKNIRVGGVINISHQYSICCGGIVAYAISTTITNCINACSIAGDVSEPFNYYQYPYCGGIAGQVMNSCIIKDCSNYGSIVAFCKRSEVGYAYCAGIVGLITVSNQDPSFLIDIDNCYNSGTICAKTNNINFENYNIHPRLYAAGIVGKIEGETINVSITRCRNEGKVTTERSSQDCYIYFAGIVGLSVLPLFIDDCHNIGDIRRDYPELGQYTMAGTCYFGGIIGSGTATITNCHNAGEIYVYSCGYGSFGGIIGSGGASVLNECFNTGDLRIKSSYGKIGGVIGDGAGGQCTNCYNMGIINGDCTYSGGIVGYAGGCRIIHCFNTRPVNSLFYCGGITAQSNNCEIYYCYNSGDITSCYTSTTYSKDNNGSFCGGITGFGGGIIINCYNSGNVTSINSKKDSYCGGIVGKSYATISNCYNMGILKSSAANGSSYSAGITGLPDESNVVRNSYNAGIILSGDNKGGIRGGTNGIVTNCYYLDACNGEIMGGSPKTEAEMKSTSFPSILNTDSIVFVYDANYVNQGYPIFGDGSEIPHSISINTNIIGGTVMASVSEATIGQEVRITVTPNPGMELSLLTVYNASDPTQIIPITQVSKASSVYSFVMPPYEVAVSASFEHGTTYSIGINPSISGGSITASTSSAASGEMVTLNVRPNSGYELQTLTVYNANDTSQTVPVTNNTFIMPSFDVMVSASFNYTSVNENGLLEVSIYPNPTDGRMTIEAEDLKHITISNIFGQVIYESNANGNEFAYDFSQHGEGVYLIRIEVANGVVTKRVAVTQ